MATAKKAAAAEPKAPAKKAAAPKAAADKKAAPAKATAAVAEAPVAKKAVNAGFMKALTLSPELAAVIGKGPYPRTEVTKKIWEYIKANNLQDQANKRMINADAKLKVIFEKPQVSMFEMTKLVSVHLK
jgi:chromatin remodeling complex protein RSC6